MICVDRSGSMATSMESNWLPQGGNLQRSAADELSRLVEVKEAFKNLVSRISAQRLPTHLGLVTFSRLPTTKQRITPVLYDFQNQLDEIQAEDLTSIYDSLLRAKEMLDEFRSSNPRVKCRIVVLTDGEDNHSASKAQDVCSILYKSDIVLDAIVIGTNETEDLFKMAKHTGGYAFHPQTRDMMFQIFLLDGCIDIGSRPDIEKVPIDSYATSKPKVADMDSIYDIPPRRAQPYEDDSFIALEGASKHFASMLDRQDSSSAPSGKLIPSP